MAVVGALILGLPLTAAHAQDAAPGSNSAGGAATAAANPAPAAGNPGATANGASAGDVVVTATKRSQRVRNVPSSVSVVTGAALAAVGPITGTGDILATVPGVRFNNLQNPLLSEVSVRGSGTERATGADPGVGLFANGVYVGGGGGFGRNFALIDSFDLERAEILKGPQGALYGRNAEFGVVNLISAEPTFTNSGYVDDVYTFETRNNIATAIVNYKVSDDVALRFGVEDETQSGGFIYNPDQDKYYDSTNGYLARAQARYQHGNLDVDFLVQTQQMQLPSFASVDHIAGGGVFATLPLGFDQLKFDLPHSGLDEVKQDISSGELLANYDFGWAKLTSTTSYRVRNNTQDYDTGYIDLAQEAMFQQLGEKGTYVFAQSNANEQENEVYQDLHLAGAAFDNRLNWLVGGEFVQQKDNGVTDVDASPCATSALPNPVVGAGICGGTPTQHLCYLVLPTSAPCPATFPSPFGSDAAFNETYNSEAAYGSLAYKIGYGFTLAGDVRYTNDNKNAVQNVYELYTTTPYPFKTGGAVKDPTNYNYQSSNVSYTATLSYKLPWAWDDLIYGKYGTGYRAGGFNFGDTPPTPFSSGPPPASYAPVVPEYGPETSSSYEIGFKGDITRFVYFTFDAYSQTTSNSLAAVGDGCTNVNTCETPNTNYTINAGTARGQGIEASLNSTLHVADGVLNLEVDGSDQTSKYISQPNRAGLPLIGTSVPQNPHYLTGATVNYRHAIGDVMEGFVNLRYDGQWGGIQDPVTTGLPANYLATFQNVDLRLGVDYKALELAFIATNLTNETHVVAQYQQAGTINSNPVVTQQRWSLPRTLSVEAKYKW